MDTKIGLPSGVNLSKVNFETNERFHKQRSFFNDSDFYRIHKSKHRSSNKQRMNSDGLSAFLQGQSGGSLESSSIDKLAAEEIQYCDLASLTDLDLELMGFKHPNERENLLKFFQELPNQDPTFDEICSKLEAQQYNSKILENAGQHLQNMQHALVEANYKLQIDIPDDVLVGDKYFASRFVIEALDELEGATNEIEQELDKLSEIINGKRKKSKKLGLTPANWILLAIAAGVAAVTTFWLMKTHQL